MSNATVLYATNYGVTADGHTDDTAAMQKAANAAMALNQAVLLVLPSGTIKVTSTVSFINPFQTGVAMPVILGAGAASTTIASYMTANAPILSFRGTPLTGVASTFTFGNGGGLQGFTIDGTNTTGQSVGIQMIGWLNGNHRGLNLSNTGSHGVVSLFDASWDSNPDFSACAAHVFFGCRFDEIGGYGFYNPDNQAAPGMEFPQTIFNLCYAGGVFVSSDGYIFNSASFASCGWKTGSEPIDGRRAFGLEVNKCNRLYVGYCEFDNNYTAQIGLASCQASEIEFNRFIHNNRATGTILRPPYSMQFGINNAADPIIDVDIHDNFHRIDPTTVVSPVVTLYQYSNISLGNVRNNRIFQRFGSNTGAATITPQVGFDLFSGNYDFDNKVDINVDFMAVFSSLAGTPRPFFQASIASGTTIAVDDTMPFDTPTGLSNDPNWPWFASYNTSTYNFTAPVAGPYLVTINMVINTGLILNTDFYEFDFHLNASDVLQYWFPCTPDLATGRQTVLVSWYTPTLAVGDALHVEFSLSRASLTYRSAIITYQALL